MCFSFVFNFVPNFLIPLIMYLVKYAWDTCSCQSTRCMQRQHRNLYINLLNRYDLWVLQKKSTYVLHFMICSHAVLGGHVHHTTEAQIMYKIYLPIPTSVTMCNIFFIRVLHTQTMAAVTSYVSELAHPLWGSALPHHFTLQKHSCTLHLAGEFMPNWQFSGMFLGRVVVVTSVHYIVLMYVLQAFNVLKD
jgi:hypothetical protein